VQEKEKFFYRFFIKANSDINKLSELLTNFETPFIYQLSKNFFEIWVFCSPKNLILLIYKLVTSISPQSILLGTEVIKPRPIVSNNVFLGIPRDLPHNNMNINNQIKLFALKNQYLDLERVLSLINKISKSFTIRIRQKSSIMIIQLTLKEKIRIYDLLRQGLRIIEPYKIPPS